MSNRGPDPLRAVYVISVAAELAGVHAQTLRIYERKGLVEPARTPGGSRRYSDVDINRLLRIQELTNEGLNLAGVKRVMDLEDQVVRLQQEMIELRGHANAAIAAAHREHRRDLVPLEQSVVRWERRGPGPRGTG
ncbi:MAG: MerR family transcriptional regulator [Actinomycetota bacterium]|jgi:MerR family transcriptional regulator/heat shock protein HspR|nr:MerR family transcriptional regulator [Actinomycetota bacterium]